MSLALLGYHMGGMAWCAPPPPRDAATAAAQGPGGTDADAAAAATAVLPAAIRRANPAPDAQARSQGSVRTVRTFVLPSLAGTARGRSGDVI